MRLHTPGPWIVQQIAEGWHGYNDWRTFAIRSPQNVCLAVVGEVDRFECERISANAHLMAAAPEMFKALKAILFDHDNHLTAFRRSIKIEQARAIIAKLEGEQK